MVKLRGPPDCASKRLRESEKRRSCATYHQSDGERTHRAWLAPLAARYPLCPSSYEMVQHDHHQGEGELAMHPLGGSKVEREIAEEHRQRCPEGRYERGNTQLLVDRHGDRCAGLPGIRGAQRHCDRTNRADPEQIAHYVDHQQQNLSVHWTCTQSSDAPPFSPSPRRFRLNKRPVRPARPERGRPGAGSCVGPRLRWLDVGSMVRKAMPSASQAYRAPFAPGGSSAVDSELCRKLLGIALERGGDFADLFFEYRALSSLSFEEGITRNATRYVSLGVGVRVQRGDATGYAYVEDLTWESMKRAAQTAARIAREHGKAPPQRLEPLILPRRYDLDELSVDADGKDKRALLERASKAAHAVDTKIAKVAASFVDETREVLIATSDGYVAHDVQPLIRFGVSAIAESGSQRESGRSGGGGRMTLGYFEERSPEWHAERAAKQALTMLDAHKAPAGQMEVVLAPGDSGILLHEAVGHGLEADFNRKGTSNYTGRVGKPVASKLCTVVDDPTFLQNRGSINVDDEGVESEKNVLIEAGVLRGYMQDRMSARHFKVSPSGNGRRESYKCTPMPRMTNTVLLAGQHDPEEIVRSVKRGVFAKTFGGGQVDISNGDFVFNLTESYLIEDGKLTAPLKGVNLIGNGPETLSDVTMLGNDVEISDGIWTCGKDGQSVPVGVGCPTIKIARITVGGTQID